jgi:hypothetical protein
MPSEYGSDRIWIIWIIHGYGLDKPDWISLVWIGYLSSSSLLDIHIQMDKYGYY